MRFMPFLTQIQLFQISIWDGILYTVELIAALVTIAGFYLVLPSLKRLYNEQSHNKKEKKLLLRMIENISGNDVKIYYSYDLPQRKDYILIDKKFYWIADEKTLNKIRELILKEGKNIELTRGEDKQYNKDGLYLKFY